jgi:hypothetical protein
MEQTTHDEAESRGEDQNDDGAGALSRYGRRALILGAGAAGAGLAAAVAGATPAGAATSAVELGESNTASESTVITTSRGNGLNGVTTSDETYACGLLGQSEYGIGVYGTQESTSGLLGANGNPETAAVVGDSGNGVGVLGLSSAISCGVYGEGGQYGVQGVSGNYGVYGEGTGEGGTGVFGTGVDGGVYGQTTGDGSYGVWGEDSSGGAYGVQGTSLSGTGVYGVGPIGVFGTGYKFGVQGTDRWFTEDVSSAIAVSASVTNAYNPSPALQAQSIGTGSAVEASIDNTSNTSPAVSATTNGTGPAILASNTGGTALQVDGVATFSRSGVAKVTGTSSKPKTSVVVSDVVLSTSSMVLTTPQGHVAGVAVAGVVLDVSTGSFTIYLTEAVSVSLHIAWFVVG